VVLAFLGMRQCGGTNSKNSVGGASESRVKQLSPFAKYVDTEVKLEAEEYRVIRENELLAVVANRSA
jgi:co-chaperonin GroES (HSP10)